MLNNFLLPNQPNKEVLVSSRIVAEKFDKQHKHVLRDIDRIKSLGGQSNFELSNYLNSQGKSQREYLLNRDGFLLLAMGFTGTKAMEFKIAFIDAFNKLIAENKRLNMRHKKLIERNLELESRCLAVAASHMRDTNPEDVVALIEAYNNS